MYGNWREEHVEDENQCLGNGQSLVMRNVDITTEDAQGRNRWRTITSRRKNGLCFWLKKKASVVKKTLCFSFMFVQSCVQAF